MRKALFALVLLLVLPALSTRSFAARAEHQRPGNLKSRVCSYCLTTCHPQGYSCCLMDPPFNDCYCC
jgi:hypothetical protein